MSYVAKGQDISIRKTDIARIDFGNDWVDMYDVNPRYLDVYVALGCSNTRIHCGIVVKGHATDQVSCSFSGSKWQCVGAYIGASGLEVHVFDNEQGSFKEGMQTCSS